MWPAGPEALHGRRQRPQSTARRPPVLTMKSPSSPSTVSFDGLDRWKAQTVSHGYLFLQRGAARGPRGGGALVAVEDGHHAKIPRGHEGAPGPAQTRIGTGPG